LPVADSILWKLAEYYGISMIGQASISSPALLSTAVATPQIRHNTLDASAHDPHAVVIFFRGYRYQRPLAV
jgi:hypothetical protein